MATKHRFCLTVYSLFCQHFSFLALTVWAWEFFKHPEIVYEDNNQVSDLKNEQCCLKNGIGYTVESPESTTCDVETSTTHFPVSFGQIFKIFFLKIFLKNFFYLFPHFV